MLQHANAHFYSHLFAPENFLLVPLESVALARVCGSFVSKCASDADATVHTSVT